MNGRRGILIVTAVVLGGVFVAGTLWLALLGIQGGGVYPPHSSLRSDPNGTRALAEALERMGVKVARNYKQQPDRLEPEGTTLVYVGAPGAMEGLLWMNDEAAADIRESLGRFVRKGGRLVITLDSRSAAEQYGIDTSGIDEPIVSTDELPNLPLEWVPGEPPTGNYLSPVDLWYRHRERSAELPPPFSHERQGHFLFVPNGPWHPVSGRPGAAYAVRRTLGKGQIVLVGASYFLTNRALSEQPGSDRLIDLLAPRRRVVFDEFHLGLTDRRGIASMAREYGLTGTMGVLGVLAALFIWRNATRIAPVHPSRRVSREGLIAGRDVASGLLNLLGRAVPRRKLLVVCVDEWQRTLPRRREDLHKKLPRLHAEAARVVTNEPKAVVDGYQKMQNIVTERT